MINKKTTFKLSKILFIFIFLLLVTIGLSGCKKDIKKYKVMTPAGAPAFSQLYLEENDKRYEVTKISGPDNIPSHFNSAEHDVILAPTNIGLKLYNTAKSQNKEFAYELAANVVFGNIYIVSKNKLQLADLANKTIFAFGKNATPGITLRYILEKNNIKNVTVEYLPGGADAQTKFIQDSNIIALIPEPALSVAEQKLKLTLNRISILDEYNKINNTTEGFPQASVFIKKSLTKAQKNLILKDLKASCEKLNKDPKAAAELASTLGYKQPKPVLIKAFPHLNIKFVSGKECKTAVENYFNIIITANPNLIGSSLPDIDFYYNVK